MENNISGAVRQSKDGSRLDFTLFSIHFAPHSTQIPLVGAHGSANIRTETFLNGSEDSSQAA